MGTTIQTNKIVFYLLNLLIVMPYIIQNYTPVGLGISVVLLLVLLYFVVFDKKSGGSACESLPLIIFLDFFIYVAVHGELLLATANWQMLLAPFLSFAERSLYMFAIGMGLYIWSLKKPAFSWVQGFGLGFLGISLLLPVWTNNQAETLEFYTGGKAIIAIYVLAVIMWTLAYQVAYIVAPGKRVTFNWLGFLLFLGVMILNLAGIGHVWGLFEPIGLWLLAMPETLFAWWRVLLITAILIACMVAMYKLKSKSMGCDGFVLAFAAIILLAIRLLMSNYFTYNWILLAILIGVLFQCFKNEVNGKNKTVHIRNERYVLLVSGLFLLTVLLLKMGLWMNLLLAAAFVFLFYSKRNKLKSGRVYSLFFYMCVVACIVTQTVAWMWQLRLSIDGYWMLGLLTVMAIVMLLLFFMKHPSGYVVHDRVKQIVCVCLAVLCLLCMNKYGTKINVDFTTETLTSTIELDGRGKDNAVAFAVYHWSDKSGNMIGEQRMLAEGVQEIAIEGEKLTIVVVDNKGILTTRSEWYPSWLLER